MSPARCPTALELTNLSRQLYDALTEVFARYSKPPVKPKGDKDGKVCGRSGLNAFALDTNGQGELDKTVERYRPFDATVSCRRYDGRDVQ